MFHASLIPALVYVLYLVLQTGDISFNLTQIVDKYGFPTAIAIVMFIYFTREKRNSDADRRELLLKSDTERKKLMQRNNELTEELISEIKKGFSCNYK